MSKNANNLWNKIEREIADGQYPSVFINAAGAVCLDNGSNGPQLPARLANMMPAEIIEEANAVADRRQQDEAAKHAALREEHARERQAARERIEAHRGLWGLWLDTGFMADFLNRLGLPNDETEKAIPADRIAGAIDWHRFRETDPRTCAQIGVLMIAPLNEQGEFTFTDSGAIAGLVNTHALI